jgi:hypothetical protein
MHSPWRGGEYGAVMCSYVPDDGDQEKMGHTSWSRPPSARPRAAGSGGSAGTPMFVLNSMLNLV